MGFFMFETCFFLCYLKTSKNDLGNYRSMQGDDIIIIEKELKEVDFTWSIHNKANNRKLLCCPQEGEIFGVGHKKNHAMCDISVIF